jgi:hypothetical protein
MGFISGLRITAAAAALTLLSGGALAQAVGAGGFGGGFGGGFRGPPALPTYGANAYAPGQGPVGARGWYGGSWRGFQPVIGPLWGGGGWGGGGWGGGDATALGGSSNVYTYNHYDFRRRDGGFYGGGGVFYGDDGYSRLHVSRPAYDEPPYPEGTPTGYAPVTAYRPSQHIIYLDESNPAPASKGARGKTEK